MSTLQAAEGANDIAIIYFLGHYPYFIDIFYLSTFSVFFSHRFPSISVNFWTAHSRFC